MSAHGPDHDRLQESAGLYVLDALEPDARAEFERHLSDCDECAAEIRSLSGVAAALSYSVPMVDPPSALRSQVMAVTGRPSRWAFSPPWLSVAALLVLSVSLAAYATSLRLEITQLRTDLREALVRLDRSEQQVAVATRSAATAEARMAVLTAPDLRQVDLQGQPVAPRASGRAFWSRSRGLVFTASDLPPLPAGRAYQLWVVTAQAPVSAGLLQPDDTGRVAQSFQTPADLPPPVAIAVTQEPQGGVPAPTGDKFLVGLAH